MENDVITRALTSLKVKTNKSNLKDTEKNALSTLIEKVLAYYVTNYNELFKKNVRNEINYRIYQLVTVVTDYIVTINDTIEGYNDVFSVVSIIYKEINYDGKKERFKDKRLNKKK